MHQWPGRLPWDSGETPCWEPHNHDRTSDRHTMSTPGVGSRTPRLSFRSFTTANIPAVHEYASNPEADCGVHRGGRTDRIPSNAFAVHARRGSGAQGHWFGVRLDHRSAGG